MPAQHQTCLNCKKSHQLKKLMSFFGIGALRILSNLFAVRSPGMRVKTLFLYTQTPNWSMIHTKISRMLANTLGSQTTMTTMTVMMPVWSQFLLILLLIIMGLQNKQSIGVLPRMSLSNAMPPLEQFRKLVLSYSLDTLSKLTRTPLIYWVTWHSTRVLSPLFLCNQHLLWILRTEKQISRTLVLTFAETLYRLIMLNQL